MRAKILWEYGLEYKSNTKLKSVVNNPACATLTKYGIYLINDFQNQQLISINKYSNNIGILSRGEDIKWISLLTDNLVAIARRDCIELLSMNSKQVELIKNPLIKSICFIGKGRKDNLLVVDNVSKKVFELNLSGEIIWASPDFLDLKVPRSATISSKGNCIIVDDEDNWVFELEMDSLNILWSYGIKGEGGSKPGMLYSPKYAEETPKGVIISDSYNNRVLIVSRNGDVVWQYGVSYESGSLFNRLWRPTCSIWNNDGSIVITDSKNDRVIRVDLDKEIKEEIGQSIVSRSSLRLPRSVQLIKNNNLLVSDTHHNQIVWINSNLKKIDMWDGGNNKLFWPRCSLQHGDYYWIADGRNNRILKLNKKKEVVNEISRFGNTFDFELGDPHQIVPSREGGLYVTSTSNNQVFHISEEGEYLRAFSEKLDLYDPHSSFEDSSGSVVICDTGHSRVIIYNQNGTIKIIDTLYDSLNKRCISLDHPRFCIEVDKKYYAILDTGSRSIIAINKQGSFLWQLGGRNSIAIDDEKLFYQNGPSFLYDPRWINYINNNTFIIGDTGNNRILAIKLLI